MNNRTQGILYAMVCVALWALIPVVSKSGQSTLNHHQFLFWSSVFSFLMVLTLCLLTGTVKHLKSYSLTTGQKIAVPD